MRRGLRTALLISFVATFAVATHPSTARAQTPPLTIDALRNGTYPVEAVSGGSATLKDGHFEAAAAPGSASKVTVDVVLANLGTISGQPVGVVVLASSGGGSGVFYDVYVVDAGGKTLAKDNLGDRIKVQTLAIDKADRIVLDLLVHSPTEGLASATLPEHRVYALVGGTLTRVASTPIPAATGNAGLSDPHRANAAFEVTALALVILGASFAHTRTRGAR